MKLPPRPYSIAHRGASAYAPDNTIAAFEKAAVLGADMWELDIRRTSDGRIVVYHDAELADGSVLADLTWDQAKTAKPDLPLLDDVLALAVRHGTGIYADIKDTGAALPAFEALRRHGIELAIIGAFQVEVVTALRDAGCTYPVSGLVPPGADPHTYAPHADVIHLCWERTDRPEDRLTPDLFGRAFADGQMVALWHEEDPVRMAAIRGKPVVGICSDRPELVVPFRPPADWPVGIVCHRGANAIAPENTIPAVECALAAGFSHAEVDLHVTADGQVVVIHDPTLDRTTNGTGPVTERTLAELRALDAGAWYDPFFAGTFLPTLEDVLGLARKYDGQLYLEFKTAPPALVWPMVQRAGLEDRCFFWSFNRDFLKDLRTLAPSARIMARRQDYTTLAAAMADYDADVIEFLPGDDPLEIASLRDSGVKSMVAYMGGDPAVFDRLIDLRPDMVNLDQPFAFRDRLTARGTRK